MYESVGCDISCKDGKEGQLPAEGSINRGFEPLNMKIQQLVMN
jgi:hypothetical protein